MDRDATGAWWEGLGRRVVGALLLSVFLSLMASVALMGLPHGWETATSFADITLRTAWITGFVVPAAVAKHLVAHFRRRSRSRTHGRYQPPPSKGGGQHR
ncbi:hypothetical protein [Streptomyces sp. NPDC047315]|uniref:DUF6338 family protein n=1 Tax=Streptomyces sp. NPDC047315 TaxID=3155142 RepID=UPI0033CDABF5